MTKTIINVVLALIAIGLIVFLAYTINEPIKFQAERLKRERAVAERLLQIRTAQQAYKGIKGEYAPTFEDLINVLSTDSFEIVTIYGDADAEEEVVRKTSYRNALDSMKVLNIDLDSLTVVPYGNEEAEFIMTAAVIEYQSTQVSVLEVKVPWKDFMGTYAAGRFKSFDQSYNPDDPTEKNYFLKFGDMSRPSLNGNWRQFGKENNEN